MNITTILVSLLLTACSGNSTDHVSQKSELSSATASVEKATIISETEFKTLVMNYENFAGEWDFQGKIPCIVDFYADWCGPCRKIAPILDELAKTYAGKVNIYKVNVDHSRNLAAFFGVTAIPTMLFCPMEGKPALQPGGMGKEQMVNVIENVLLKPATPETPENTETPNN